MSYGYYFSHFCQIAVTLDEWEHIADPFEKATHYTEKALYSVLTTDIIPVITAELKVSNILTDNKVCPMI